MSIYLKRNVVAFSPQHLCNQWRPIKDINAVVATRESREHMPDPKTLVGNGFKDDATIFVFVLEFPLSRDRAIFP